MGNIKFKNRPNQNNNDKNSGGGNQSQSVTVSENSTVWGNITMTIREYIPKWVIAVAVIVILVGLGALLGLQLFLNAYQIDTIVNPSPFPSNVRLVQTLSVAGNARQATIASNACVDAGDRVYVSAGGVVTTGQFIGDVTPNGSSNPLAGFDNHDIVSGVLHGALLCRIQGTSWERCGTYTEFNALQAGCVEFRVNDSDPSNNSGQFDVFVGLQ